MRNLNKAAASAAFAAVCLTGFAVTAQEAQQRTQEETLLYTDPTVATPGHYVIGVSGELWGIYGPDPYYVGTGTSASRKTTYVKAYQYGGDAYFGYDDWLLTFEGLGGSSSESRLATVTGGGTTPYKLTFPLTQFDVSVRKVFPKVNWHGVTPYVIFGWDYLNSPETYQLTQAGYTWASTGTSTFIDRDHYNTAYLGAGMLYEFSRKAGLRFDLEGGYAFGSYSQANGSEANNNGPALLGHFTVYYRFTPELTAQFGVKGAAIDSHDSRDGLGAYLSLGYLHRF